MILTSPRARSRLGEGRGVVRYFGTALSLLGVTAFIAPAQAVFGITPLVLFALPLIVAANTGSLGLLISCVILAAIGSDFLCRTRVSADHNEPLPPGGVLRDRSGIRGSGPSNASERWRQNGQVKRQ